MVQPQQTRAQRLLGCRLDGQVERRLDLQTFVVEPVDAVGLLEVLADLLGEERPDVGRAGRPHDGERARHGLAMVGLGDEPLGEHPVEHVVAARHHAVRVPERAELARPLHDAGEGGGLRQGQLSDTVAEIGAGGALHAVVGVAQEDHVAVHREDLLFGELLLELDSEKGLGDLAPPALLVGEEELPGELHGDRGGPLGVATAAQVHRDRTQDAERVDAAVAEEVAVLGRENGVAQQGGISPWSSISRRSRA